MQVDSTGGWCGYKDGEFDLENFYAAFGAPAAALKKLDFQEEGN